MPLSLRERQAVVRELAPRYRKAAKHERSQMFDQIPSLCRYDRGYAARALRATSALDRVRPHPDRGRKPQYGPAAKAALIRCGLAPAKLTPAISLAGVLTISRFFRNRSV